MSYTGAGDKGNVSRILSRRHEKKLGKRKEARDSGGGGSGGEGGEAKKSCTMSRLDRARGSGVPASWLESSLFCTEITSGDDGSPAPRPWIADGPVHDHGGFVETAGGGDGESATYTKQQLLALGGCSAQSRKGGRDSRGNWDGRCSFSRVCKQFAAQPEDQANRTFRDHVTSCHPS